MWIKGLNRGASAAIALMAALLYCLPLQARQTLVPDAYGYQWIDSAERYGPAFNYVDISQTGAKLSLANNSSSEVRFGFGFQFYGQTYYTAWVSGNGYISFGPSDNATNPNGLAIPQAGGAGWQTPPFIAPWFDDLDPAAGGVYFQVQGTEPNRRVVVQWQVAHRNDSTAKFDFELVLNEATNRILFQYKQASASNTALSNGASATAGIQGSDTAGINYSASQPQLTNQLAVGFVSAKYGYAGIPSPPQPQNGAPGQVVTYQVEVINGLNADPSTASPSRNFTVEVLPGSRWPVVAPTSTGLLAPGQSTTLQISVTLPPSGSGAGVAEDIASLKVYAPLDTTSSSGGNSNNTTQNTQQDTGGGAVSTPPAPIVSLINLKTTCLASLSPATPCFQQDSDGDGVPDSSEAADSVHDASKVHGLKTLDGEIMDIDVTGGALQGFTLDKAAGGPANVQFAAGLFNYRAIPNRIADSVVVRITPAKPWSDQLVLYKVDSAGKYTVIDAKKWTRVANSNAIELTLVDGADFDEDGAANGVIVDPLAIGVTVPAGSSGGSAGAGAGALSGELLLLVLLAGVRYAGWRSRRLSFTE